MSISPALMPRFAAPSISRFVTPENKRRRAELENNREKFVRLCSVHLGKNEDAYVSSFRRVQHVDMLIRRGIDQGRWDA